MKPIDFITWLLATADSLESTCAKAPSERLWQTILTKALLSLPEDMPDNSVAEGELTREEIREQKAINKFAWECIVQFGKLSAVLASYQPHITADKEDEEIRKAYNELYEVLFNFYNKP